MFELILIDFSWLYNKYYYVTKSIVDGKNVLPEQKGEEIYNTLLRMLSQFLGLVKEKCFASKIVLVLDSPTSSLKTSVEYDGYKQNRNKEEKKEVYKCLRDVVGALAEDERLIFLRAYGYEADQVIACLAEKYCENQAVLIYSGDKDLLQLTYHKRIKVSDKFEKGHFILKTDDEIFGKFKNSKGEDFRRISNNKRDILKYRVLKGDPSDNLGPVFPRIKDKEIVSIVKEYWIDNEEFSPERGYKILEDIKGDNPKLAEKLEENMDNWVRNYSYMNLHGLNVEGIKRVKRH